MMSRTEEYWLCKYTVESGSESSFSHRQQNGTRVLTVSPGAAEGQIYAQASKLEEFRQKKNDGKDFTFVVDGSFQYGQDKAMTTRFPFYHDKTNKPYQHRFVENTYTGPGGKAVDFLTGMGFKYASSIEDNTRHFAGHYLHDF
ncbi:uncharacterized protein PV07_05215 [Cladophialophora immunda]|uniref:Uncharacterized protein n=1 Tax=Cladophialophora immunda TaxID=569365 RepID=A0A0D2CE28_9EURO|nr:uncharacterized protein PV07_05215 [Cladophialophora immunda]KIW29398.1 hypothetical protein PV07_05215 [Cladophialophora immunda]